MKYAKDADRNSQTLTALEDLAKRLEMEAAALVGLDTVLGHELAQERLEQAAVTRELFDYYAHL